MPRTYDYKVARMDLHLADMIKWFGQELESSEVRTRINGMVEEQFLDFLHRALQALHGSTVNPSYTRSVFHACTDDIPQGSRKDWCQVLLRSLRLLSNLNGSQTPQFWHLTGLVDSEPQ
jgi:hypothetical protein